MSCIEGEGKWKDIHCIAQKAALFVDLHIMKYLLLRLLKDKEGVRRKLEVEEAEYISRRKECVSNLIKLEQQVYQSLSLFIQKYVL